MTDDLLRNARRVASGAAVFGGGLLVGLLPALLASRRSPPRTASLSGQIEEFLQAARELRRWVASDRSPGEAALRLDLERALLRVEGLARTGGGRTAVSSVEEILAAVEAIVAARVGDFDERIREQVEAVRQLRDASAHTDALIERLMTAVRTLLERSEPRKPAASETTSRRRATAAS